MAVVYRGEDLRTGTPVAVKALGLPDAWKTASLRREIHALARLSHPDIVRVLATGVDDGLPWLAMELLEGDPLARHAAALPAADTEAGLVARLLVIRRLCSPLSYLHGEGIVHRDLKPDNVLVRPGGRPVLLDLGLMATSGKAREELQAAGVTVGTVAYMAPEQALGELADARADLYALGCILYELLAGRPPFVAADGGSVLSQHLALEPEPPSRHNAFVPGVLDALTLALLEKEPRRRIGHADDVAAALAPWTGAAGRAQPRPRPYLYRAVLRGRDDALDEVGARVPEPDRAGRGGVVLVAAEPGMGKTRFLLALEAELRERGLEVLSGRTDPPEAGRAARPLAGFAEVLQAVFDRARQGGPEVADRLLGSRRAVLEPILTEVPALVAAPPSSTPPPPEEARQRLVASLIETIDALARERPLALLLDDVDGADGLSIEALARLARRPPDSAPLLVVATLSDEHAPPPLTRLADEGAARVDLSPLAPAAVAEAVGDMLALDAPPRGLVSFLIARSEGNPLLVTEHLHLLLERGLLRRVAGCWRLRREATDGTVLERALPPPRSVGDALAARLEGLPAGARALLDAIAVLGPAATEAHAGRLSELDDDARADALRQLMARRVVGSVDDRLRLDRPRMRPVALALMSRSRRSELEARAARLLRDEPRHAGQVAYHLEAAGEVAAATPAHLAAARSAAGRFSHDEAEGHYRAFLRLSPRPSLETVLARHALADDVLRVMGRNDEAGPELEQARDDAAALGLEAAEARCLSSLGQLARNLGRPALATRTLQAALQRFRAIQSRADEGRTLRHLGHLHYDQGRLDEARCHYEAAMALATLLSIPEDQTATLGSLANVHADQGRIGTARRLYRETLRRDRELRDRFREAIDLENLATLYQVEGAFQEARDLHDAALAVAREVGNRRLQGVVLVNVGGLHEVQGRLEDARAVYEAAARVAREVGDRRVEGNVLANLGSLRVTQGHLVDGASALRRAIAIQRQLGNRLAEGIALTELGSCLRQLGRPDEAEHLLREGFRLHRSLADPTSESLALTELAEVRMAAGAVARARRLARRALRVAGAGPAPISEAWALLTLARLGRAVGDGAAAEGYLDELDSLLESLGHRVLAGLAACERGELAVFVGADASAWLATARAIHLDLELATDSRLGRAVVELAGAMEIAS